jgi:hypothetical protein
LPRTDPLLLPSLRRCTILDLCLWLSSSWPLFRPRLDGERRRLMHLSLIVTLEGMVRSRSSQLVLPTNGASLSRDVALVRPPSCPARHLRQTAGSELQLMGCVYPRSTPYNSTSSAARSKVAPLECGGRHTPRPPATCARPPWAQSDSSSFKVDRPNAHRSIVRAPSTATDP